MLRRRINRNRTRRSIPKIVRRRKRTSVRAVVHRPVALGVPKQRWAKLSYCDVDGAEVVTTLYAAWAYQSSLFDPYVAVGGHQPMYFDQYASMYTRYTVLGIAYNIEVTTDASTYGPLFVTVTPTNVAGTLSTLSLARERTGTRETAVSHGYKGRLKGYMSVARVLGVNRNKMLTDDQYSALITTSPSQMAYLNIQAWNPSASGNIKCYLSVRLTYYCRFFDPLEQTQS